jgi:hypothetical protein
LPIIPDTAFTNGQYSCLKKHTEQHFIPMRRDLWSIDSFEEFTEERANLIKDFIKNRYPDIYHE